MQTIFTDDEFTFIKENYHLSTAVFLQCKSGSVYDITNKVFEATSFLDHQESKRYSFKVRLWHIVNNIGIQECLECQAPLPIKYMKSFDNEYPYKKHFCSDQCSFFHRSNQVHSSKYLYDRSDYTKAHTDIEIGCPDHGYFWQKPHNHVLGSGCPDCKHDVFRDNYSYSKEQWIDKFQDIHGDKYDYSLIETINGATDRIAIICPVHGQHDIRAFNHSQGQGCFKCGSYIKRSKSEIEVHDFVVSLIGEDKVTHSERKVTEKEIDIYVKEYNLGIEYNGIYWHSSKHVKPNYHNQKTKNCYENGINLIHIFSNEWNNEIKKPIWKSIIRNKLGMNTEKQYARKCTVSTITNDQANEFLDKNHLQGSVVSSIRYGLFNENELISVMTFAKSRFTDSEYELMRYASKVDTNVVGGASKLFRAFLRAHKPNSIVSYADRRFSSGDIYKVLGFDHLHNSRPNYFYTKDFLNLESRIKFQKHKLKDIIDTFDENLSEWDNMSMNGYEKIYDCGNMVWIWEQKKSLN